MTGKAIACVIVLAMVAAMPAWAHAAKAKADKGDNDQNAENAEKTKRIERRIVISPSVDVFVGRAGTWMGIRMGDVPEALAQHLQLKKPGVIVRNVAVASQRHTLTVTLAKPPPLGQAKMKYEEQAPLWQDHLNWKSGTLRKGPKGWTIRGGKVPEEVEKFLKVMPKSGTAHVEVRVDAGQGAWQWKMKRTDNGKTVEIQQERGGKIRVTKSRSDRGQAKSVTRTYKDADALRKGDAEAYEMYKGVKAPRIKVLSALPIRPEKIRQHVRRFRIQAPKLLKGQTKEIEDEIRKQMQALTRDIESALAEGKARAQITVIPPVHLRGLAKGLFQPGRPFGAAADREFKVDENGRIEIRIRKGRDDLTLRFKSVKELQAKHPKLYEEYQRVLKSVE